MILIVLLIIVGLIIIVTLILVGLILIVTLIVAGLILIVTLKIVGMKLFFYTDSRRVDTDNTESKRIIMRTNSLGVGSRTRKTPTKLKHQRMLYMFYVIT